MNIFLNILFIFFIGSIFGYILEFCYRTIKSKKIINPGFLAGPYLPIYGFGLTILTLLYILFKNFNVSKIFIIIIMGSLMTIVELIGGLLFMDIKSVKLWDYSEEWGNYKGLICPKFSIIWTLISAIYYYFLANHILILVSWFEKNQTFSFFLGIFFAIFIIDFIYSTNLYHKIKNYAKENKIDIKLEELKIQIKDIQNKNKEKYSFIFSLNQNKSLKKYLDEYKKKNKVKKFELFK